MKKVDFSTIPFTQLPKGPVAQLVRASCLYSYVYICHAGVVSSILTWSIHFFCLFIKAKMNDPVLFFHLFSTWIFISSALYPLHGISTFPLNLVALVGLYEIKFKGSFGKIVYNLILHLAPFLWIPYSFSDETLLFCVTLFLAYLVTLIFLKKNCYERYTTLLKEEHMTFGEFLRDRYAGFLRT